MFTKRTAQLELLVAKSVVIKTSNTYHMVLLRKIDNLLITENRIVSSIELK
jgi:hypothetical protein